MKHQDYLQRIRQAIAENKLEAALVDLRSILEKGKELNIVILQTARLTALEDEIMQGTVPPESAAIARNNLRANMLTLVDRLTEAERKEMPVREVLKAVAATQKNVASGATITAGGDVNIGDRTIINNESKTSKRLRIFTYILVPLLAIAAAVLAVSLHRSGQPVNLKVRIENMTPSSQLPAPEGDLTLTFASCDNTVTLRNENAELLFDGLPPACFDEPLRLRYQANGFYIVDTTIDWRRNGLVELQVRRNDALEVVVGTVVNEAGLPLGDTQISIVNCCTTVTDETGAYRLSIPFSSQREEQELIFSHAVYGRRTVRTPVLVGRPVPFIFDKR